MEAAVGTSADNGSGAGKRRRLKYEEVKSPTNTTSTTDTEETLTQILQVQDWDRAITHVKVHHSQADTSSESSDPSPLALACRYGAPLACIQALLEAAPSKVRHMLDARGTPIHEAIVCESVGAETIAALLKVDEQLGNDQLRATLMQDVDGVTPLHLLIRRRFQSHILYNEQSEENAATGERSSSAMMEILEMLVRSCPQAVVIPDRGEYEEPPIVYALKANIYAPSLGSEDATLARVEAQIHDMVACMLRYCPEAASRVFTGYRGHYTALHSAVFHGRYTTTIDLLLRTERENRRLPADSQWSSTNSLLANTQGEMPLHFSSMRGERPQTVALLAQAAPEAICARDSLGLTPYHWLWIRFVCNMLALDRDGRGEASTIALPSFSTRCLSTNATSSLAPISRYTNFSSLEQGDFDQDLQLIKRMDPPVDFLRMRHIPSEVLGPRDCYRWAERSVAVLKEVRDLHDQNAVSSEVNEVVLNRRQVLNCLFWTKTVSFLQAVQPNLVDGPKGENTLVHTAFATPSCTPAVISIVAALYPEELKQPDESGRWPIHYAALRPWHLWDFPRQGRESFASAALIVRETLRALCLAIDLSPPESLRTPDKSGRWVLHQIIDTLSQATARSLDWPTIAPDMLRVVKEVSEVYPDVLSKPDGRTGLIPFLQATAKEDASELFTTSLSYELLRMDPAVLQSLV
jgi:ankyrin repeat protein